MSGTYQPPAVAPKPGAPAVRLLEWKPRRSGALRGFVSVVAGRSMKIIGIGVMVSNGSAWVTMPQRALVIGAKVLLDAAGKVRREAVIEFVDKRIERQFSDAIIVALLNEYPDALADDDGRGGA